MKGYFNREDLTTEVVHEGWFYTGDIGYLTEEGWLVLVGRVRNEINCGGMKIIPEDIDFVLERNKAIAESCTFAVADEIAGQVVAVAVVFKKDTEKPSAPELKQWIGRHLSDYKVPKIWYELEEMPKTKNGKINRFEIASFCKDKPKFI